MLGTWGHIYRKFASNTICFILKNVQKVCLHKNLGVLITI